MAGEDWSSVLGTPAFGQSFLDDNPGAPGSPSTTSSGTSSHHESNDHNTTTVGTTGQVIVNVDSDRFDNGVVDVSIIPYMRHLLVEFTASGLRPNRRVYFFFDGTNVTNNIFLADEMTLVQNSSNAIYNTGFSNNDIIRNSSNTAQTASIVQAGRFFDFDNATPSLQDDGKPRLRRRILKLLRTSGRFANNENFVTSVTANTGIVAAVKIRGGRTLENFFQNTTSNTIILSPKTASIPNNYWGTNGSNTIILMARGGRKAKAVRAYIGTADNTKGFDNVTRTLYLMNTLSQLISSNPDANLPTDNSSNNVSFSIGSIDPANGLQYVYTDFEGKLAGAFSIPSGVFRTGERIFRIIDDVNNDPADCTTRAEYNFVSSGLKQTKQSVVINQVSVTVIPPRPEPRRSTDPIAQTFFVSEADHPNGVFISSVGLYFYNKDEILPVTIQIRPTVNGFPDSYKVVPNGEASLDSEMITTSTNGDVETKIKFATPVYLAPGEYALVVKSDSLNYEVFVAELGSKILGSTRTVSEQPYVGSFFKSQNGSTWDAIQLEDLTFNLYKCKFASSGSIILQNELPSAIVPMDKIYTHIDDTELPNTRIVYSHSYDGGTSYTEYDPDTNFRPTSGRVTISTSSPTYRLRADITTNDTDVSPILYTQTSSLVAIENFIDNGEFDADDFTIVSPGYYSANINGTVTLNISDYRGAVVSNVSVTANVNSTGNIANIKVIGGGSTYVNTATVVVNQNNSQTTNAVITLASELSPTGGPIFAKYISRQVTLASGFDASDLRVFLTAYKPSGTDIKVYYKIRNINDPETFDAKSYVLMKQTTPSGLYSGAQSYNDAIEYEFIPDGNTMVYTTSSATYDVYNQYAIKIALLTNDTTNYPIVYDMRAIALPT